MRPSRCFRHAVSIPVARRAEEIIPAHYSAGPADRTVTLEFRVTVFPDGAFSAGLLADPVEGFCAPLFGAFVETHPDVALRSRLNRF